MVKSPNRPRSRFLCILGALFVFLSCFLFVPASAMTVDQGDIGRKLYLDYSFDVDIECTKVYDGESPRFLGLAFPHMVYNGAVNNPVVDYGLVGSGGTKHYIAFGNFEANPNPSRARFTYSVKAYSAAGAPNSFVGDQLIVFQLNRPVFEPLASQCWFTFPVGTQISVVEKGYFIRKDDGQNFVQQTAFPFEYTSSYTVPADQTWYFEPPSGSAGDLCVLTDLRISVLVQGADFSGFEVGSTYFNDPEGTMTYRFFNDLNFAIEKNVTINETPFPTDWLNWLYSSANAVFAFELLPGLSLGKIFAGIFGVLLTWFLIHLFG